MDNTNADKNIDGTRENILSVPQEMNLSINEYNSIAENSFENKIIFLKKIWGLTTSKIIGTLSFSLDRNNDEIAWLENVKSLDGKILNYPKLNEDGDIFLEEVGSVFIGRGIDESKSSQYAEMEFEIAPDYEQKKKKNPFQLQGKKSTLKILEEIPEDHLQLKNGRFLIYDSVKTAYIDERKEQIEKEIEEEISARKEQLVDEEKKVNELKASIAQINIERTKLNQNISKLSEQEIELSNKIDEKEKIIKTIYKKEKELESRIDELRSYIKNRVEWFKKLDFITEDFYKSIIQDDNKVNLGVDTISFESIGKDFVKLVDYIHSYTFHKGIIYPRYLIEDFLTLLRTNDFIVLSGLSGSGKTQIVKSFAEALGGLAKIIPVKPNWTSSEDLLGYYNPLQKSYLTTPFLDTIIEAQRNPERLYLICLDEMNLARVEYYFADFLSALETRNQTPEIILYSYEEQEHIISEFKSVIKFIDDAVGSNPEESIKDFGHLLSINEINEKLKNMMGLNDNETFISLHSRLRRMVSGVLNVPNKLLYPSNVRIIGAVNIDETTHFLSPKVLDRSHIIKFNSPLRYEERSIQEEINNYNIQKPMKIYVPPSDFIPNRTDYPAYTSNTYITNKLKDWANNYLEKIGIDLGLRSFRQAILYSNLLKELGADDKLVLNNVIRHKILPRLAVDGNKNIGHSEETVHNVIEKLFKEIRVELGDRKTDILNDCIEEFDWIIKKAISSDYIYNYWL